MNRHPFLKTHQKTQMNPFHLNAAVPGDAATTRQHHSGQPPYPQDEDCALASPTLPRRWNSTELLADGPLAEIQHGDQVYRLRLTALGKLILTK